MVLIKCVGGVFRWSYLDEGRICRFTYKYSKYVFGFVFGFVFVELYLYFAGIQFKIVVS